MKNKILFYLLVFVLTTIFNSCTQKNKNSNRVYFTIDSEDRKILVPALLNDSIVAQLAFDTGGGLVLDSTFYVTHPSLALDTILEKGLIGGVAWSPHRTPGIMFKASPQLKIGKTSFKEDFTNVFNWKDYMNSDLSDGMFNIPRVDTTHVWELNFEHNYMEIHDANDFQLPKNCFITSLIEQYNRSFYVNLPLHIQCLDEDTITINQTFFIDTGMAWDIAVKYPAEELDFFDKKKDVVWTRFMNKYHRHYTVNATLFDDFKVDSLRIYTFDYKDDVGSKYLVGLNFLKRFNVFFDMKNKQLGLQPINSFRRVVNPLHTRFHYSTQKTSDGKYIISKMADNKGNYYKAAGLQEGDEIVKINNVLYGDISKEMAGEFKEQDIAIFDIIRNGKPMKITVKIDHNEEQGD